MMLRSCWFTADVPSVFSLQGVGGVGWVLGLLCFKGLSKHCENILAGLDA